MLAKKKELVVFFRIHYKANEGEKVVISGCTPELGNWVIDSAHEMELQEGDYWTGRVTFSFWRFEEPNQLHVQKSNYSHTNRLMRVPFESGFLSLEYSYVVCKEMNYLEHCQTGSRYHYTKWENSRHRASILVNNADIIYLDDIWNVSCAASFPTLQFPPTITNVIDIPPNPDDVIPDIQGTISVALLLSQEMSGIYDTPKNLGDNGPSHEMFLAHNISEWKLDNSIKMRPLKKMGSNEMIWYTVIEIPVVLVDQFKYKYVMKSLHNDGIMWEYGSNRDFNTKIAHKSLSIPSLMVREDGSFRIPPQEVENKEVDGGWLVTGYVGLANTFASCSINAVLQVLYQIKPFRERLLDIYEKSPKSPEESMTVCWTIGSIFHLLKTGTISPDTKSIVPIWGLPEDVHEFQLLVFSTVESELSNVSNAGVSPDNKDDEDFDSEFSKMVVNKKNPIELFGGKMGVNVDGIDTNFRVNMEEDFRDISLEIVSDNIYECIDHYFKKERLEGEYRYLSSDHGLQVADKKIDLLELPSILNIHLKRFYYDPEKRNTIKKRNRLTFPSSLHMNKYLHNANYNSVDGNFDLYAVMTHEGDSSGASGHFYSYVRLQQHEDRKWYKFNDEKVTFASPDEVFEGNYGTGREDNEKDLTHAYVLVYVRSDQYQTLVQ